MWWHGELLSLEPFRPSLRRRQACQLAPARKMPTRLPLGRATCFSTLFGAADQSRSARQRAKTSIRGKRVVANMGRFCDRVILLYKSGETWPSLRWRPWSKRIRRNRFVIDQPRLKVFLLLAQLAAALEGTQLVAECPRGRTRSRQPRASCVHPGRAQWSDGSDHETCARFPYSERRVAIVIRPELASFAPVLVYAR